MKEFNAHGIRFGFPETWSVADESSDEKTEVTVQSDGTVFWSVAVFSDASPEEVVDSAVEVYREAYPDLDVYPPGTTEGPLGPVVNREVEFVCLELIAAARIAAYRAGDLTVMILVQGAEPELEDRKPVLEAMTASLRLSAGGATAWPDELFSG